MVKLVFLCRRRPDISHERYAALLTNHQRSVLDLYLRQDWSLSEIAGHQGTSRAAAHDIVRRAVQSLADSEARLGLVAEAERRRDVGAALVRELAALRRRLNRLEARLSEH